MVQHRVKQLGRDSAAVSRATAPGLLYAYNQTPMTKLTPADIIAVRQAYINHEPIAAICERHGISTVTLHKHCADLHDRRPGWQNHPQYVPAMKLRDEGLPFREIAKQVGLSIGTLHKWATA